MANASLILETALLLLVAFILGCVVGSLARWLSLRRRGSVTRTAAPAPVETAVAPLVAAPQLAPLFQRSPGPSPTQRLAAAAGRPAAVAPPAAGEPPPPAVVARDRRGQRRPARVAGEVATLSPAAREAAAMPPPAAIENDAETAARQAVEGGWTPPRRRVPVPFPEPGAAPADDAAAEAAMAGVRSGVAAARAAADAALAGRSDEPHPEAKPTPRIRRGFGAPELLAAPRQGGKDDLTAIRGISPSVEASLNALGIFHFDQLARWDRKGVVWVDNHLGLKGRIAREKWPEQARSLAAPVRAVRPRR